MKVWMVRSLFGQTAVGFQNYENALEYAVKCEGTNDNWKKTEEYYYNLIKNDEGKSCTITEHIIV